MLRPAFVASRSEPTIDLSGAAKRDLNAATPVGHPLSRKYRFIG